MGSVHAWTVQHLTYPLWQKRTRGMVFAALERLERSQWLGPDELRVQQWARLQALLAHAAKHVPFYRKRFAAAGITPADIRSVDDLRLLPPLERAELRDRVHDLRAAGVGGRLVERRTSGSTGVPVVVWATPEARDQWVAATLRARRWWRVEPHDRRVTLMSRYEMTRERWLKQFLLANVIEFSAHDLSDALLQDIRRRLRDPAVRGLIGYPSSLSYLARFVEAGRTPGLRAVFTTGEMLYPDQRALLRRVFRCPVVNEYGSAEVGHVAAECPFGRWHIAVENGLIEFDAMGEEIPHAGSILVTDLTNYAMPLIRYRLGDLGSPGERCPCGRGLPVLRLAAGRVEDLVVLSDGRRVDAGIFSLVVDELERHGITVHQYHVVQHAVDRFEVLVVGAPGIDAAAADVTRALVRALGARVAVTLRSVDAIPAERTGKRRRFISHVTDPSESVGIPS